MKYTYVRIMVGKYQVGLVKRPEFVFWIVMESRDRLIEIFLGMGVFMLPCNGVRQYT